MKKFKFNFKNPASKVAAAQAPHKNKFISLLIIDESGSMAAMRRSTIETYESIVNQIYTDRTKYPDLDQYINLWSFGDVSVKERIPPTLVSSSKFPEFNYQPAGGTPLYDALGHSLLELERFLKRPEMEGHKLVNVNIITDGEENSSSQFNHPEIARLITRLKENKWNFHYFGTEHDIESAAARINITETIAFEKSAQGFKNMHCNYAGLTRTKLNDWLAEFKESNI